MIYTVTLNPSLDYLVTVSDFQLGKTNRTQTEGILAGGKGINVSVVLQHLEVPSTALGFTAGFTGEEIERRCREYGIRTDFIRLREGFSRINFKLLSADGTEVNGQGPAIAAADMELLMQKLEKLQEGDSLILAGSIPASLSKDVYEEICSRLSEKKLRIIVDAAGDLLRKVLCYHPFLIKPNRQELSELFQTRIATRREALPYAKKLQELGARNVLVSMGGDGAMLLTENGEMYEADAPKGRVVNSVGAGDSMVAGFLAGYEKRHSYEEAFLMGLAAGSASAFSENLATKEETEAVLSGTRCSKTNM